ncbi:MAG: HAD-IA family hydrolase [Prevotellaceae bacterium]|jgi:HAD superfamily hydrolase (TIGR01509 family)|nr:HAD-IA family hydrolase [Prevotellaceae bacterium]
MKINLDLKAVFFDMDGVLFDSMPNHARSWIKAMQELDIPFTEYDAYLHEGRTGASTINTYFLRYKNREATVEEQQSIYRKKTEYFEKFPPVGRMKYAYELLQKVKAEGLDICVVTGSAQMSLLDHLNDYFPNIFQPDRLVTALDVKFGKPSPEPYLMALQKTGVAPSQAVVVENAPLGVQSAKAAGIFTIAVNTGILEDEVLRRAGADIVYSGGMKELYERW